jgi:UDP-glucose 4-epimerase
MITGGSEILNCGYGHGYSVHEIVESVKRVSGANFVVTPKPRRAGDPAAVVADTRRIRRGLSWMPSYDDIDTIVAHALVWERKLAAAPRAGL